MSQRFLTRVRGAEGGPLAAALASLMLVVALIGGMHIGAMAATDGGSRIVFVFCSHGAGGNGQQPTDPRADLCCVAGCLMHAPALTAPPPAVPAPELAGGAAIETAPEATVARHDERGQHPPRGPPSFA